MVRPRDAVQRARLELRRGPLGRELAVHAKRAVARRERCFQRRYAEKRRAVARRRHRRAHRRRCAARRRWRARRRSCKIDDLRRVVVTGRARVAARAYPRAAFLSLLPGAPAASFVGSAVRHGGKAFREALLAHRIRLLAAAQRPKLFRLHDHESRLVRRGTSARGAASTWARGAALPDVAASPRSPKCRDHSTASAAANRE
ncbi:hypothetical protein M885DRAFT_544106 [Pelagophyceae sp. CCMP2097]|nr:hypothetical protein M885DRAFT_544106 [Pelagophyceae sp. CCMP2097]